MQFRTSALLAAAVTTTVLATSAQAAVVVAPNAQAGAPGDFTDNNKSVFGRRNDTDGQRFQQVYGASQFGAFGVTENIGVIAFRAKANTLFPTFFGGTAQISNIIITLSTTGRESTIDSPTNNGINNVFATNIGADVKTVYSGPLTVTTPVADSSTFGYVVNLQSLFAYTKANGNLLLDITIPAGATVTETGFSGYAALDAQVGQATGPTSNDGVASAFGTTGAGAQGSNSTTGIITQFTTVVPEPTSLAAIAGLGALVARRRRA